MIMMMDAQLPAMMMRESPTKVPRVLSESNLSTASTAESSETSGTYDLDSMMDQLPVVSEVVDDEAQLQQSEEQRPEQPRPEPQPNTSKPSTRRRSSILKHYRADEILIKEKGWKNLTKPDARAIPKSQCSTARRSENLSVSFHTVEFRCHDQCVGDNPSVSIGTPIALDWPFEDTEPIDLNDYEAGREGSRRNLRQMMMNYFQRRTLLSYRYGITDKELDEAARAADKIRHQRSVTRALLPTFLLEDLVTSAARKTKRALASSNNNKPQPESLSSRPDATTVEVPPESPMSQRVVPSFSARDMRSMARSRFEEESEVLFI
jgi:hypothetical protein